jgi:exosortase K
VTRKVWTAVERAGVISVALGVASLLKWHYSRASADELRWILAPTSWLTSLVVPGEMVFRTGEGYLNREQSVLISPACAGINFMAVLLLTLVVSFEGGFERATERWRWLLSCLGLAYITTLVVNAARIGLSVALAHLAERVTGLTFHSVHRLIGIVVYLAGLLLLCSTVRAWLSSRGPRSASDRWAPFWALASYASVTLLVPLFGGAARNPDFWSHAAPVSVAVVVSSALLFAVRGRTWDDGRHEFRSTERHRVATEQASGR